MDEARRDALVKCVAPEEGLTLFTEASGEGQPLVFSHGLTNTREQGRMLLAPLLDHYRLIGFDQRGHGESTPFTDPARYTPERMTADIGAVMDAFGVERAVVAGESMGAATALLFALRWPQRVEKLWLVAPAMADRPNLGRDVIVELGQRLNTPEKMERFIEEASRSEWPDSGFTPATIAILAAYFRAHRPASLGAACEAVADWVILKSMDELRALRCPVHIIAWEGDLVHPVPLARAMTRLIPRARLTVVSSATTLFNDMPRVGRIFGRKAGERTT